MSGYTPLFSSIVASTIWREAKETKIVWITMLAMADARGIVEASVPGLADMAKVSMDECKEAIRVLTSPDEWSRTKDYDGRRIEEVDGGWRILNLAKFRQKCRHRAEYMHEYYLKTKGSTNSTTFNQVNQNKPIHTHTQTHTKNICTSGDVPDSTTREANKESEPKSKVEESPKVKAVRPPKTEYDPEFEDFWAIYPRHTGKGKAYEAWQKAIKILPPDVLVSKLMPQLNQDQWTKDNGQFIPMAATWLNQRRWDDDVKVNIPKPTPVNHRPRPDEIAM